MSSVMNKKSVEYYLKKSKSGSTYNWEQFSKYILDKLNIDYLQGEDDARKSRFKQYGSRTRN